MVQPGDLVLVHMDNKPAFFARVEEITSDYKPQWYQVKLLVLQIPLMVITWILRRAYIDGDEFTMGGRPVRVAKVVSPEEVAEAVDSSSEEPAAAVKPAQDEDGPPRKAKVLSFTDRRKKDQPS